MQQTIETGITGNCWIGLRRNGTGEFNWISGRGIEEFQYWRWGEPGNQECASFRDFESKWGSRNCPDMLDCYICMAGKL